MRKSLYTLIAAVSLSFAGGGAVQAQYYDWGQDPATVRWRSVKTPDMKFVFPDTYQKNATRIMHYMDTIRPQIGYGFTHGPMRRMPLVIHSQNFSSNGIVMLAPKRIELIVTPDAQQFAFPALKQLSAHEYRHAVQYNNLNQGMIKVLSRILGQQGSMVGLAFMPVWAMEGDAVMAETQMSTFGRGIQPSFSIEYRAMAIEGRGDYPIDKYFSGSYRHYMPDHYRLGYQIMSWADEHYGENILDKTARFSSRNPYLIFPFTIALKKYYGTTEGQLFSDSFGALYDYWRSLPVDDDTAQIIGTPLTSYTTYASPRHYPIHTGEGRGEGVVALKSDLDRRSRLVLVDGLTGGEETLCRTGVVNSPLSVLGRRIYWTEYRQSTFWEQRVHSQLCSYDVETGKKTTHPEYRNILFPVFVLPSPARASAVSAPCMAAVEYNIDGTYTIKKYPGGDMPDGVHSGVVRIGESQEEAAARDEAFRRMPGKEWHLPDTVTVHGLAYERLTDRLYFIGLSDAGMWIGSVADGEEGFRQVTHAAYTTIANLTAGEGKLYFNSIASGKDEAHMYDVMKGKEFRITTSRYGSFSPSETNGSVLLTTYTPDGYLLSRQELDGAKFIEVPRAEVPQNVVNPERRKWPVMNMDKVTVADTTRREVKKYRKGLNLFNFHSWAPVYFEPDRIMSEARFDIKAGATLMSQNNLNSTYTQISYGWTGSHNLLHGKFNYSGWAPKFELEAQWSDEKQAVARPSDVERPTRLSDFLEFTGRAYLPFVLSSGASFRTLMPSVEYQYNNTRLWDFDSEEFKTGMHKVVFGLQYVENRRMAHRDFLPQFGYAVRASFTTDPVNDEFGKLWTLYGRVYLPGIGLHHSLMLRTAYQKQKDGTYVFRQKELFPRGAEFSGITPREYAAVSADYQLPVWYPDGGINSVIYFRRIRLNLGGDYARMKNYYAPDKGTKWHNVWSYGGDVVFDVVPLRLPSNTSMTVTISIRKPSDRNGVTAGFGVSLPL